MAAWVFRVVGFLLGFTFGLSLGFLGWVFLCTREWLVGVFVGLNLGLVFGFS